MRKPLPHSMFEALVCVYHPGNDRLASLLLTERSNLGTHLRNMSIMKTIA